MIWAGIAALGAAIALGLREWIEKYERLQRKRANCFHLYGETSWKMGHGTRICERCGYQDWVEKEEKPR